MNCKEIIKILEKLAPPEYAESWDNSGFLAGREEKEVSVVMLALDATEDVISQAIHQKVDMLITHHPMIFKPLKRISAQDFIGKKLISLIQNDISYYAIHTNFDAAVMAQEAGKRLGLSDMRVLSPLPQEMPQVGIGCFGRLPEAVCAKVLAEQIKRVFGVSYVTYTGNPSDMLVNVALCPGSGKSVIADAIAYQADVLITGDIDHHSALDAKEQGLFLMDAGHFGTEHFMTAYLKEFLQQQTELVVCTAKETSVFHLL